MGQSKNVTFNINRENPKRRLVHGPEICQWTVSTRSVERLPGVATVAPTKPCHNKKHVMFC